MFLDLAQGRMWQKEMKDGDEGWRVAVAWEIVEGSVLCIVCLLIETTINESSQPSNV